MGSEVFMKTYSFSVFYGDDFRRFIVKAKTLATALKTLESDIIKSCFYYRGIVDWRVSPSYTLVSSSGVRSCRRLRKLIRGIA